MALVLVADDDRMLSHLAGAFLRRAGHVVESAPDVATTLQRLAQPPRPDCLVLDVNMPDGTASDVLRQLAGMTADLPVVLLTGASAAESDVYRRDPHVRAVVGKPISPDTLVRAVTEALPAVGS